MPCAGYRKVISLTLQRVEGRAQVPNSSVRTVVLFSIIALVMAGAVIGGVRLTKARNDSYATTSNKVATTGTKQQPAQQKADTPKPAPSPSNNTSQSQTPKVDPPKSTTAVPPVTNPDPSTSSNKTSTPAASTPSAQRSNLPATSSLTPIELLPTVVLMILAAFFGTRLLRARADYRRYIGS